MLIIFQINIFKSAALNKTMPGDPDMKVFVPARSVKRMTRLYHCLSSVLFFVAALSHGLPVKKLPLHHTLHKHGCLHQEGCHEKCHATITGVHIGSG